MSEERKYRRFPKKTMKLKELLPMIRSSAYSNYDNGGTNIVICPECEEWTHVTFNENSGLLDLLGDLTVESICAEDNDIEIWVSTDEYNWFRTDGDDGEAVNTDDATGDSY